MVQPVCCSTARRVACPDMTPTNCARLTVLLLKHRTCIVLFLLFTLQLSNSLSCKQLLSDNVRCRIPAGRLLHIHRRADVSSKSKLGHGEHCGVSVIGCPQNFVFHNCITVELGYNVKKGIEYIVSL
jgi:hypothetical protein